MTETLSAAQQLLEYDSVKSFPELSVKNGVDYGIQGRITVACPEHDGKHNLSDTVTKGCDNIKSKEWKPT